jgi:hypothetical protein
MMTMIPIPMIIIMTATIRTMIIAMETAVMMAIIRMKVASVERVVDNTAKQRCPNGYHRSPYGKRKAAED